MTTERIHEPFSRGIFTRGEMYVSVYGLGGGDVFTRSGRKETGGRKEGGSRGEKEETKNGGEEKRREEMIEEAPCIRLLVSGAATYDFIGCLPLHRLDESKI